MLKSSVLNLNSFSSSFLQDKNKKDKQKISTSEEVWPRGVSVVTFSLSYPAIISAHTPIHCNWSESMDPGGDAAMNRSRIQTVISNMYHRY